VPTMLHEGLLQSPVYVVFALAENRPLLRPSFAGQLDHWNAHQLEALSRTGPLA
jgi:hypothetical protein